MIVWRLVLDIERNGKDRSFRLTRQDEFRRKLQGAYEQPTYEAAKKTLEAIKRELKGINLSAVNSLEEGFEETLTLHRLGMFEKLGRSFKTTNVIENVNSLLGIYTDRVDYWKNSEQRQRWVGRPARRSRFHD